MHSGIDRPVQQFLVNDEPARGRLMHILPDYEVKPTEALLTSSFRPFHATGCTGVHRHHFSGASCGRRHRDRRWRSLESKNTCRCPRHRAVNHQLACSGTWEGLFQNVDREPCPRGIARRQRKSVGRNYYVLASGWVSSAISCLSFGPLARRRPRASRNLS